jgi:1,4-dihydroxy-2-naphthoate polyprenyltransferase
VQVVPTRNFWRGFWCLADPKISLASMASMLLGASAAAVASPLHFGWLAATVLGIFAVEVAKNASGEIFDFDSGTDLAVRPEDRSPFSGGKRVLVDGLLTRRQTIAIAASGYAVALVTGVAIVLVREPRVLWIGVAGMLCAYLYHAPPVQLSYRGLGELAVAICYGPLIACGTFLVQRGSVSRTVLLAAIPLGLLIAAFLWINEFPDFSADRAAGKRTLVVRLGRQRARHGFALLVASAFASLALLPAAGASWGVYLGGVAMLPAARAVRTLARHAEHTAALIPAQGLTLLAFVLFAIGVGIGFWFG